MTVLLVSWILTLLSIFSLTFNQEVRADFRLSRLENERIRSMGLAMSGISLAGELLSASVENDWDSLDEGWDHNAALRRVRLGDGFFSIAHAAEPGAEVVYGIEDEGRRIPLHLLDRDILEKLPGISKDALDAVESLADSAKSGATPIHPAELPGLDMETRRALREYVTIFPDSAAIRNAALSVNVNTAPAPVLEALGVPDEAITKILRHRNGRDGRPGTADDSPFEAVMPPDQTILEILTLDAAEATAVANLVASDDLVVHSSVFRIRARGWLEDARTFAEIEAVVRRSPSGRLEVLDWRESWES